MALTFILGQPCAGGNHWDVTLVGLGGRPITLPITYPDLLEPLSDEKIKEFATLYLRFLISLHPNASMNIIRGKLASASIPVSL